MTESALQSLGIEQAYPMVVTGNGAFFPPMAYTGNGAFFPHGRHRGLRMPSLVAVTGN